MNVWLILIGALMLGLWYFAAGIAQIPVVGAMIAPTILRTGILPGLGLAAVIVGVNKAWWKAALIVLLISIIFVTVIIGGTLV